MFKRTKHPVVTSKLMTLSQKMLKLSARAASYSSSKNHPDSVKIIKDMRDERDKKYRLP